MYFVFYLIIINMFAVFVTVYDKLRAKRHGRRVSESFLLFVSLLGGGVLMYITMLLIRHKTRKIKFMLGIPLIIVVQIIAFLLVMNYAA